MHSSMPRQARLNRLHQTVLLMGRKTVPDRVTGQFGHMYLLRGRQRLVRPG